MKLVLHFIDYIYFSINLVFLGKNNMFPLKLFQILKGERNRFQNHPQPHNTRYSIKIFLMKCPRNSTIIMKKINKKKKKHVLE